jgi:mannose-6-phosphate isomerase
MDGKPRELHTALAAQALDYHVEENYRTEYSDVGDRAIQIIDSPYFDVRVMEVTAPFHRNLLKYDSFVITMCMEGSCRLKVRSTGDVVTLREGHSALVPACVADYDIIPMTTSVRLLDAFIDNMDRTLMGKVTRFLHMERQ